MKNSASAARRTAIAATPMRGMPPTDGRPTRALSVGYASYRRGRSQAGPKSSDGVLRLGGGRRLARARRRRRCGRRLATRAAGPGRGRRRARGRIGRRLARGRSRPATRHPWPRPRRRRRPPRCRRPAAGTGRRGRRRRRPASRDRPARGRRPPSSTSGPASRSAALPASPRDSAPYADDAPVRSAEGTRSRRRLGRGARGTTAPRPARRPCRPPTAAAPPSRGAGCAEAGAAAACPCPTAWCGSRSRGGSAWLTGGSSIDGGVGLGLRGAGGGRLAARPVLEGRADGERRREAVRLLVREGARRRSRLGEAAMAVIWRLAPPVAVVLERHERTRGGAVDDREPAVGHRRT